jgi:hypothetical protein
MVMPGVHDAAPDVALQIAPMWEVPAPGVQFEPLQQRFADAPCGVQVRPGAQPPVVSQRQPCVPTMHVAVTPPDDVPPLEPELAPELAPEELAPEELAP